MNFDSSITQSLKDIASKHLLRADLAYSSCGPIITEGGRRFINLSSNDYLGLGRHEEVIRAAANAVMEIGASASSSRLVTGTHNVHHTLERELARFFGFPACLLCGTGYLGNLTMLQGLVKRHDIVVADKLVHASLIDGVKLTGSRLMRFKHNDVSDLRVLLEKAKSYCSQSACSQSTGYEDRRIFVVTESVFSMDGDVAPLIDIAQVVSEYGAILLVDDAHGVGVFGPSGRGFVQQCGIVDSVSVMSVTLSKAFGSYGGVILCSAAVREWLVNTARPFIYNTALPPMSAAAALAALQVMQRNPSMGSELLARSELFRRILKDAGLNTLESESHIIPVVVGDNKLVLSFSARLRELGIIGIPIRTPTVPRGTARVRFSVSLGIEQDDLHNAARNIVEVARYLKVI